MKQISPYIELCEKLGLFVQQLVDGPASKISVKYFGKLGNIDNKLLTLAVQKGYLSKISENANDVNAPAKMKHLGIEVESVNSSTEADYSELVEVVAYSQSGETHYAAGTVMGTSARPKIVRIDSHEVEINPHNKSAILLRNQDTPGMVGIIGTIIGKYGCNIANMTLSRDEKGGMALSVYELDALPAPEAVAELKALDKVEAVRVVDFS